MTTIWERISKVRFKALMASGVLLVFGSQIMGKTVNEWRTWDELQRTQVATEATVSGYELLIAKSGEVTGHMLTYEFVAPGKGGSAVGGSSYSRSELQAKLQEQFFNGGSYKLDKSELPKPRTDGQQFFTKTQRVEQNIYNSYRTGSKIPVVYAANNPSNSLVIGTGRYPIPEALMISGLLVMGAYLAYLGISPCFRYKQQHSNQQLY
jgi:hypothetical protein